MIDFEIGIPLPLGVPDHVLYEGRHVFLILRRHFGAMVPVFVKAPTTNLTEEKALMVKKKICIFGHQMLAVSVFASKKDFCSVF